MSTDITKSGIKFRILASLSPVNWNVISFWGKAEDSIFENGKSVEEALGHITGITSSPSSNSTSLTTSAYLVNTISGELASISIPPAAWSSNTIMVSGVAYHTYTTTASKILLAHPLIYLNIDNVATEAEKDAWGELEMVANTTNKQLTFYIENIPSVELNIGIKGVEL